MTELPDIDRAYIAGLNKQDWQNLGGSLAMARKTAFGFEAKVPWR